MGVKGENVLSEKLISLQKYKAFQAEIASLLNLPKCFTQTFQKLHSPNKIAIFIKVEWLYSISQAYLTIEPFVLELTPDYTLSSQCILLIKQN